MDEKEDCMKNLTFCSFVALSAATITVQAADLTGRWYWSMSNKYVDMTSELNIQSDGTYSYHMASKISAGCEQGYLLAGKWTAEPGKINFVPLSAKRGCSGGEMKINPQKETSFLFNSPSPYHMVGGNLCFTGEGRETCYSRDRP
jgi:hypothetical protein